MDQKGLAHTKVIGFTLVVYQSVLENYHESSIQIE